MISTGQAISVGVQALAFSALEKSDTLNRFVDWISGGKLNRDSLAQNILHKAVELGTDIAVSKQALGERSAKLVPLMREAVIDNDMGRMKSAVAELASEKLGQYMERDGGGLTGVGKRIVDSAVRSGSAKIAEVMVGDHAAEKIMTTMVKQHGWAPLETYLDNQLGSGVLGKFAAGQVKSIVQRAMVDKPEFDMSNNAEFRLAAGVTAAYLSGEKDYEKPLRDYAPTLMALKDAAQKTVQIANTGLDALQDTLGIEPKAQMAEQVYARELAKDLPEPVINESTTARDLAKAVVLERIVEQQAPENLPMVSVAETLDSKAEQLQPEQRAQLEEVVDRLSPEQIAPLGERSGIEVAYTWGNTLDRVETYSHQVGKIPQHGIDSTEAALGAAPTTTLDKGGYRVGEAFAQTMTELDLDLPGDSMGYYDASVEITKSLWNTAWSALGYSGEPSGEESAILKQLYNVCDKNMDVMQEASRFLDADLAQSAVGQPMLNALAGTQPGVLDIGGTQVRLDPDSEPTVAFQVRNEGQFIRVSVDVKYKIDAYGSNGELRTPQGDADSFVTAAAVILVRPGEDGAAPRSDFRALGELTSIFNTVSFDRATGAVE